MTAVLRRYDRLDVAFNNAGIEGVMAPTVDCTERTSTAPSP